MWGPAADSAGRWSAFRRLTCIKRRLGVTLGLDRTTYQIPYATSASNEMHGVIAARPRVARLRDGVRPGAEPAALVDQQHCMFCHTIDMPFLAP